MAIELLKSCIKLATLICLAVQLLSISTALEQSTTIDAGDASKTVEKQPQLLYFFNLTDANAVHSRLETATLEAGKQVRLVGTFYLTFPNSKFRLRLFYDADSQGFRAHYTFGTNITRKMIHRLGTNTLKTLAG